MDMKRTGGGLITNSRTQRDNSGAPQAQPVKMAQPSRQQAPQQPMSSQGMPPQGMPPQPQGAAGPMMGQAGPQAGAGAPQGLIGAQMGPQQTVNDVANNALLLLHHPETGQHYQQMIQAGPQGAAEAAATIYDEVVRLHAENQSPIDEDMAADAAELVLQDITDMGLSMGAFKQEPMIDGFPASAVEFVGLAIDKIGQRNPDVAASLEQLAAQGEFDDEDLARGQKFAQYASQQGGVQ